MLLPIIAIITFSLGVALTASLHQSPTQVLSVSPPTVTLCELARHSELYEGQVVLVEATASTSDSGTVLSYKVCGGENAWTVVMLNKGYKPKPEVESFFSNSGRGIQRAKVVIIGRFSRYEKIGEFGHGMGIQAFSVVLK